MNALSQLPPGIVAVRSEVIAMARKVTIKAKPDPKVERVGGLTIRGADLTRSLPFEWMWEDRVLMSYLNLVIGEEGIGKGNLAAYLAAMVTRGRLPGDLFGDARRVLFVGDEDSWDHIWTPRLEAAGADLALTRYVESGATGALDVKKDADGLRAYITKNRVALVYFDQLLDNLGVTDHWKDKDTRDKLAPLRMVARETSTAMLASMHPNKRGGSFRDRISGTAAFNALSRSSLLVAPHPDEEGRRVVVRGKGNYGPDPQAFEFRIEPVLIEVSPTRTIKTSRIDHIRETALTLQDVLDATSRDRRDPESQTGHARAIISDLFKNGEVKPAREVIDLLSQQGIPERTAQRAREEVGIHSWKEGYPGVAYWGQKIRVRRNSKPASNR